MWVRKGYFCFTVSNGWAVTFNIIGFLVFQIESRHQCNVLYSTIFKIVIVSKMDVMLCEAVWLWVEMWVFNLKPQVQWESNYQTFENWIHQKFEKYLVWYFYFVCLVEKWCQQDNGLCTGHSWCQNEYYVGGATCWSSNCLYNICKCNVILSIILMLTWWQEQDKTFAPISNQISGLTPDL